MRDYPLVTIGIVSMACKEILANEAMKVACDLQEKIFLVLIFFG